MLIVLLTAVLAFGGSPQTWLEFQSASDDPEVQHPFQIAGVTGCYCQVSSAQTSPLGPHTPDELIEVAELRVEVRRGKARLVSVASVTPGMMDFLPCIHNELAAIDWKVRRADFDLRVVPAAEPREPEQVPAEATEPGAPPEPDEAPEPGEAPEPSEPPDRGL